MPQRCDDYGECVSLDKSHCGTAKGQARAERKKKDTFRRQLFVRHDNLQDIKVFVENGSKKANTTCLKKKYEYFIFSIEYYTDIQIY